MRPWCCQVFGARVHEVSGSIIVLRGSDNFSIMDRFDIGNSRNRDKDRSNISAFRNRDRSDTSNFRNG